MAKPSTTTDYEITFRTSEATVGPMMTLVTDNGGVITQCHLITKVKRYERNKVRGSDLPVLPPGARRTRLKEGELPYSRAVLLQALKTVTREKPASLEYLREAFTSHNLAVGTLPTTLTVLVKKKLVERVGPARYISTAVEHVVPTKPVKQKALPAPVTPKKKSPKRAAGDTPGARETMIEAMKKNGPMRRHDLEVVLVENGFSGATASSALWALQQTGQITKSDDHLYTVKEEQQ